MRFGGQPTDSLDGGAQHFLSFVQHRLHRAEVVECVALLVDAPPVRIEVVIDVDDVGRGKDAAPLGAQVDTVAPAIVGLVVNVNRITDLDVNLVLMAGGEFVQAAVRGLVSAALARRRNFRV